MRARLLALLARRATWSWLAATLALLVSGAGLASPELRDQLGQALPELLRVLGLAGIVAPAGLGGEGHDRRKRAARAHGPAVPLADPLAGAGDKLRRDQLPPALFPYGLALVWVAASVWVLSAPFAYRSRQFGTIYVPAGFETDLISTPAIGRLLVRRDGPELPAAIIHDWLYTRASAGAYPYLSRRRADGVFLEAMRRSGVAWWRRSLVYAAVRVGGFRRFRTD